MDLSKLQRTTQGIHHKIHRKPLVLLCSRTLISPILMYSVAPMSLHLWSVPGKQKISKINVRKRINTRWNERCVYHEVRALAESQLAPALIHEGASGRQAGPCLPGPETLGQTALQQQAPRGPGGRRTDGCLGAPGAELPPQPVVTFIADSVINWPTPCF